MAFNRRRYGQGRASYGGQGDGGGPGADDELAELEALLAGDGGGERESLGTAWRSRITGWGGDAARRTRGRELVESGAVHSLRVEAGRIVVEVVGSQVYRVQVVVRPPSRWEIESMRRELAMPGIVRQPGGLTSEARMMLDALVRTMVVTCTCPDGWGCKHAIAALLAFGPRLDAEPNALLTLWGAADRALSEETFAPAPLAAGRVALTGDLGALFGIDLVAPPDRDPSTKP